MPRPRPNRAAGPLLALLALLAAVAAGCGGEEPETTTAAAAPGAPAPSPSSPTDTERPPPEPTGADAVPEPDEKRVLPTEPEKAEAADGAERAYRAYIRAINERDAEALCDLLSPRATAQLRPPVDRGSCAESLSASIGYEDPRGYPVWERTVLNGIESVAVGDDPGTVRLTAATLTEFEDRDEPSVESDVAYLELTGGEWRLSQPTAAAYRAVGRPELPPSVIAPPAG